MKTFAHGAKLKSLRLNLRQHWSLVLVGGIGAGIHVGTAALRLNAFVPYPKLLDFSAFYAAAWSIRLGQSPYRLTSGFLNRLQLAQALPFVAPPIYNPPLWPWLLQPLAMFRFPVAASVWLALNLALLLWASRALSQIAGVHDRRGRALVSLLVLTFGPVFLDLTLGQTSVVLLAVSLAIGRSLSDREAYPPAVAALASAFGVGAKLFPVTWLVAYPLMRRWRETVRISLSVLFIFALGFWMTPVTLRDYADLQLIDRLAASAGSPGVDDQSLLAWLDRLALPHSFQIPLLNPGDSRTVVWSPPWTVATQTVQLAGIILVGVLLIPGLLILTRVTRTHHEAAFYVWILYSLTALLHIERYNHTLLLPAMAWLWSLRGRQRQAAVLAYFLAGLARLTHLWAVILPFPLGPLASGFGLYSTLLVGAAVVVSLWSQRASPEVGRQPQ